MSESKTVGLIFQIAQPLAENLGLEIWDIKLVKEGSYQYLRVFIDKESGVTIEDCENMSHALDQPLDELDPIPDSYSLEVCSPGIERELTKDWHFEKFLGWKVKARLIRKDENGKKDLVGKLQKFDKDTITLENDQNLEICIERKNISHINLVYEEEITK